MPTIPSLIRVLARRLGALVPARVPVRGTRSVPGLKSDVRVTWTEGGLPHVDASNATDALFAQGWLCAADRLFQMDLARRTARGELAEIFGDAPVPWLTQTVAVPAPSVVELDHLLRQLALGPVAEASIDALSSEARVLVEAYAAGVSAYVAEAPLPLEYQLLGGRPRAWTAADSAAVWKLLAFQLSSGWRRGLVAEALRTRFPEDRDRVRALLPEEGVFDAAVPPSPDAERLLPLLEGVAGRHAIGGAGSGGASAWALSKDRSESGRAIVCGDPHVLLRAPAAGWLVHLTGGGLDVAGLALPGVPGVVMGHNAHLAWSVSAGGTLDATWAREAFVDGREVRTPTGSEAIREETVEIAVKDGPPQQRTLRFSGNGPLFGAHLAGLEETDTALALRWTGHLPTPELEAVLQLDLAESSAQLSDLAERYGSPALSVVHADVDGRVGWRLVGLAPKLRPGRVPLGAVPAWRAEDEWLGVEPPESLPSIDDPPDGLVTSGSEPVRSRGTPLRVAEAFAPAERARRIRRLLGTHRVSLADVVHVQADVESELGLAFRDRFVRPLRTVLRDALLEPDARAVLDLAAGWGGHSEADSAGAAAAWTFFGALLRRLFEPLLGERLFHACYVRHALPLEPVLEVLTRATSADAVVGGWPFYAPDEVVAAAREALTEAGRTLRERCGGGPRRWRLGAARDLRLRHPLSSTAGLGRLFSIGPVETGGDEALFANGEAEMGPAFRHAVEAGAWDAYRVVLSTGQGGDPVNGRYREHVERWRRHGWFTFPFTREAVERAAIETATLVSGSER